MAMISFRNGSAAAPPRAARQLPKRRQTPAFRWTLLWALTVSAAACEPSAEVAFDEPTVAAELRSTADQPPARPSLPSGPHSPQPGSPSPATDHAAPWFRDVARQVGLDWVHDNGMSGEYYFPEMTGAGCALFDYDNDGDLDAYLVQGELLGKTRSASDAILPPPPGQPPGDRLFANTLNPDPRTANTPPGEATAGPSHPATHPALHFEDVTEAAGLGARDYGMAVAVGDVDGDGWPDLFVANLGDDRLLRNGPGGRFSDHSADLGAAPPGSALSWSSGASFCDLDLDGDLDLFVVRYVSFDLERNPSCYAASSRRDYCGPSAFAPQTDQLLRNQGDGRFVDETMSSLGAQVPGPGLGVVAADVDGDGWPDLFVANDGVENALWINQRDGSFRDEALLAGVALNREGRAEASMGVDVADIDDDGDEDLFVAHLAGESNTLYINNGAGLFDDRTREWGLATPSLPLTSFGCAWLDADSDGLLDLLTVGGAVRLAGQQLAAGSVHPLAQHKQLFLNRGDGRFRLAAEQDSEVLRHRDVGRGAALGDVDNDGDADLLVLNNGGPLQLLLNTANPGSRWIGLRLRSGERPRDVPGAKVMLQLSDGRTRWRRAHSDGSFASSRDPRVLLALAPGEQPVSLAVVWPGGEAESWPAPPQGRYTTLTRGRGEPWRQADDDQASKR